MSSDATGWRGLAADLMAADGEVISPPQLPVLLTPAAGAVPAVSGGDLSKSPRRRRRSDGETFASTNQLVGLWFPHDMARELRRRAEAEGLSNSEFVRQILWEQFSRAQ